MRNSDSAPDAEVLKIVFRIVGLISCFLISLVWVWVALKAFGI